MRLVEVTSRRVGRLRPARADPIGVLDSFVERLVPWEPARLDIPVDAADATAPAGDPQTLQYPSSISPGQLGSAQR
jgi:hypothetical protein